MTWLNVTILLLNLFIYFVCVCLTFIAEAFVHSGTEFPPVKPFK